MPHNNKNYAEKGEGYISQLEAELDYYAYYDAEEHAGEKYPDEGYADEGYADEGYADELFEDGVLVDAEQKDKDFYFTETEEIIKELQALEPTLKAGKSNVEVASKLEEKSLKSTTDKPTVRKKRDASKESNPAELEQIELEQIELAKGRYKSRDTVLQGPADDEGWIVYHPKKSNKLRKQYKKFNEAERKEYHINTKDSATKYGNSSLFFRGSKITGLIDNKNTTDKRELKLVYITPNGKEFRKNILDFSKNELAEITKMLPFEESKSVINALEAANATQGLSTECDVKVRNAKARGAVFGENYVLKSLNEGGFIRYSRSKYSSSIVNDNVAFLSRKSLRNLKRKLKNDQPACHIVDKTLLEKAIKEEEHSRDFRIRFYEQTRKLRENNQSIVNRDNIKMPVLLSDNFQIRIIRLVEHNNKPNGILVLQRSQKPQIETYNLSSLSPKKVLSLWRAEKAENVEMEDIRSYMSRIGKGKQVDQNALRRFMHEDAQAKGYNYDKDLFTDDYLIDEIDMQNGTVKIIDTRKEIQSETISKSISDLSREDLLILKSDIKNRREAVGILIARNKEHNVRAGVSKLSRIVEWTLKTIKPDYNSTNAINTTLIDVAKNIQTTDFPVAVEDINDKIINDELDKLNAIFLQQSRSLPMSTFVNKFNELYINDNDKLIDIVREQVEREHGRDIQGFSIYELFEGYFNNFYNISNPHIFWQNERARNYKEAFKSLLKAYYVDIEEYIPLSGGKAHPYILPLANMDDSLSASQQEISKEYSHNMVSNSTEGYTYAGEHNSSTDRVIKDVKESLAVGAGGILGGFVYAATYKIVNHWIARMLLTNTPVKYANNSISAAEEGLLNVDHDSAEHEVNTKDQGIFVKDAPAKLLSGVIAAAASAGITGGLTDNGLATIVNPVTALAKVSSILNIKGKGKMAVEGATTLLMYSIPLGNALYTDISEDKGEFANTIQTGTNLLFSKVLWETGGYLCEKGIELYSNYQKRDQQRSDQQLNNVESEINNVESEMAADEPLSEPKADTINLKKENTLSTLKTSQIINEIRL